MIYQIENFNGQLDFRCRFHDGWIMESHLHEYSEFLYCQEGVGMVTINGVTIPLPEKHLIWIPPNYIHQYDCPDAKVICAVFSNDLIPLFFHKLKDNRLKPFADDVSNMTNFLDTFYHLKKEDFMRISGYLNLIGEQILARCEFEQARRTDSILYQEVISYLSEHFRENISLKKIAKTFGYNEKYLSHCLHELTGVHFSKLVSMYRLEYAKKLLRSKKRSNILEIAQESGFSAPNTFNRIFKESTGITPSQYKKEAGHH